MGEENPPTKISDTDCELPTVAVTNVRSLEPKLKSVVCEFKESDINLLFVSEIWEKDNQVAFNEAIENLEEIEGIEYLSTSPRPNQKRGGGVAILSNFKYFVVKKLDINHPKCLEVLWALARKTGEGRRENIREFILCSFYSPLRGENMTSWSNT